MLVLINGGKIIGVRFVANGLLNILLISSLICITKRNPAIL